MARSVIVACCPYHLAGTAAAQGLPERVYADITPSLVNNDGEGVRLKYLKACVSLKAKAESEIRISHHLPSIQKALVILFSS